MKSPVPARARRSASGPGSSGARSSERGPLVDQIERDRICRELDRSFLVEAPAGSGKTHSMSSRMVAGIAAGRYRVEEMAGVTFTRKAASELRGRLQLALEAALEQAGDPVDAVTPAHEGRPERARLEQALRSLDRMFLGTVHAFCGRLLREYPVEARVAPGFREVEEPEDEALRRQVFRRCLEEPDGLRVMHTLAESGNRPEDLLGALNTLCENGEADFPSHRVDLPDPEPCWEHVDEFGEVLARLVPRTSEPDYTCQVLKRARSFLGRWRHADRSHLFNLLQLLLDWESRSLSFVMKCWAPDRQEQRAVREQVQAAADRFRELAVEPFLEQWRAHLYGQILPFLTRVRGLCAEERRHRGWLNFNDLLILTSRLLRDNPTVRERLQGRYRWLFVDEFQDTDPIQAEVLFYLAAEPGQNTSDWTRLRLRPGALFIVGDPKQSIYRFRRADIETYNLVRARLQAGGGCVAELKSSFRSHPQMCAWTNRVFEELLPGQSDARQAAFSPLVPTQAGGGAVYALTEDCLDYRRAVQGDALRIAAWIRAAVDSGQYSYGDFMIQTWKRSDLSVYAAALEARGVPSETTGGLARSPLLVPALLELLTVLADPYDQVALVGVLRGPLFGLKDDGLFRHRQAEGAFTLAGGRGQGDPDVHQALSCLRPMREWVGQLPAGAAVERILDETGLLARAATAPGGLAEVSELLQVADQVRLLSQEGLTLSEAMRELSQAPPAQPLALSCGRSDVVRVMNLHQAKGLEARVVFLASPTGGYPPRASARITRSGGKALGFLSLSREYKTFAQAVDWPEHQAAEIGFLEAEFTRLLYVAATRAEELLVVSRWSGTDRRAGRPWARLEPFLEQELPWPEPGPPPRPTVQPLGPSEVEAGISLRKSRRETSTRPTWSRVSVTASLTAGDPAPRVFPTPVPDEVLRSERPDAGTRWGSLIHRLLEQLMLRPDLSVEELERLARWFCFDQPELAELVPLALQTLESVKQGPLWKLAMQAGARLVEVPFGVRVDSRFTFGVLDLALREGEEWKLVDYKTDLKSLDKLVETYAGQVEEYARAWTSVAEEPVTYAGLYGVREARLSEDLRT